MLRVGAGRTPFGPFAIQNGGGAMPPADPSALFLDGSQGFWYDPSDLDTMFQDAAGTTPVTAAGQPIGKMLDKSGNGNHWTQASASSRPVLMADGDLLYLNFDGANDYGVTGSINLSAYDKFTLWTGLYQGSGVNNEAFIEFSSIPPVSDGIFNLFHTGVGTSAYSAGLVGTGGVIGVAMSNNGTGAQDTKHLIEISYDFAAPINQMVGTVDGINEFQDDGINPTGSFGNFPLFIGMRAGASFPFGGRIYSLIGVSKLVDMMTAMGIESYVSEKTGV